MSWKLAAWLASICIAEIALFAVGQKLFNDERSPAASAGVLVAVMAAGILASAFAAVRFAQAGAVWRTGLLAGLIEAGLHVLAVAAIVGYLNWLLAGMRSSQAGPSASAALGLLALLERAVETWSGVALLIMWLAVAGYAAVCAFVYPLLVGGAALALQRLSGK